MKASVWPVAKDETDIEESKDFALLGLITDTFIEVLFEDGFKEVFPTKLLNELLRDDNALLISPIAEIDTLFVSILS